MLLLRLLLLLLLLLFATTKSIEKVACRLAEILLLFLLGLGIGLGRLLLFLWLRAAVFPLLWGAVILQKKAAIFRCLRV